VEVRVRGRTSCQTTDIEKGIVSSKKVANVKVELWEKDLGEKSILDSDDLIQSTMVNDKGIFTLEGGQDEIFNLQEFYVKIHFPCVANTTCNFVKYHKYCEKHPGGYYMAKKQDVPQELRYVEAKNTFLVDYRMGYAHHEIDSNIPFI
ncbi:hypothetical protein PMAYCL1PPCAC_23463, partial [Pristionchus mayeri]